MVRLENYINRNFSALFFSIFVPLYGIASLVFFIKTVSITSIIKVTFLELLEIYLFVLPQILFYTIPIAFFAGAVMTLVKLSFDYELIVLFSLGVKPSKIARIFAKPALLTTIVLLVLSLGLIPQAKQLYKGFISYKKSQATLNIKASEFGQKFGTWLVFIGKEKGKNSFEDIVMFNQKAIASENFIIAKKAKIDTSDNMLKFVLSVGKGYTYKEGKLTEIEFDKMIINDLSSFTSDKYKNVAEYWMEAKKNRTRAFDFSIFTVVSVFPLISIFIIMAIGIINPRYEKQNTYMYMIIAMTLFYVIGFILAKSITFYAIGIIPLIWIVTGYLIYIKTVKKRY
ncbi:LptF/LptG family permease [Nitrosophilus alvini]|uniref:LptF/LptG family permease n=1 Tax=Nitrosophilus alvini TaxID=2714855 RepID=UPI0019090C9C|nr:LptF/LptG family permease [Nitrosophilus alvini]